MSRMINESVMMVIEELSGGRLKINHYSDFPQFVMRKGFGAAERLRLLKNNIVEVKKGRLGSARPGSIHIQWNGKHLDENGTTVAAKYRIMYCYVANYFSAPWLALCLAKVAKEGKSLVSPGYLNPRNIDLKKEREEYWDWISSHFGSTSPIPSPKTDPELFRDILKSSEPTNDEADEPAVDDKSQAVTRLKALGVDFSLSQSVDEERAVPTSPQTLADFKTVAALGILDYIEDGDLIHYEVKKSIDLDENVANMTCMKPHKNPMVTCTDENGATFHRNGRVVEWVHGGVVCDGRFLGNAGTVQEATKVASRILNAKNFDKTLNESAMKIKAENTITD